MKTNNRAAGLSLKLPTGLGAFLCLTFIACTPEKSPSGSWEIAAQGLYAGAMSNDARLLLVGSMNHGASLWRIEDHERLYNWTHAQGEFAELVAAAFSPDGTRAVTTDPRTLVLWDTQTGSALNYWATPGAVLDVAVLNNNRQVLIGLSDHSALLFDAVAGDYLHTFLHLGKVGSVATDDIGRYALTGSDDNTAALWSLNDGKAAQVFQHDNPVRTVALSSQGNFAFTAAQGDLVAIWKTDSSTPLHVLHNGVNHGAMSAQFSADERYLAVGYAHRKVALYDVATGNRLHIWDAGTRHAMRATGAAIMQVAFAESFAGARGSLFAISGDGRLLRLSLS